MAMVAAFAFLFACDAKDKLDDATTECETIEFECSSYEECVSLDDGYYIEYDGNTYKCDDFTCSERIDEVEALITADCTSN